MKIFSPLFTAPSDPVFSSLLPPTLPLLLAVAVVDIWDKDWRDWVSIGQRTYNK